MTAKKDNTGTTYAQITIRILAGVIVLLMMGWLHHHDGLVKAQAKAIKDVRTALVVHQTQPWHGPAGATLDQIDARLTRIEDKFDLILLKNGVYIAPHGKKETSP